MRVTFSGQEYSIEFQYSVFQYGVRGTVRRIMSSLVNLPQREKTTCVLKQLSGNTTLGPVNLQYPLEFRGTVVRYFRDVPNREKGRRAALAAALQQMDLENPCWAETAREAKLFDKARRTAIWEAWLNRPRTDQKAEGKHA